MQPQDPVSTEWQQHSRGILGAPQPQQLPPQSEQELQAQQYKEHIQALARQSSYSIELQDVSTPALGQKIQDPLDRRKTIIFYGGNEWEIKEYKRHKITRVDFQKASEIAERVESFEEGEGGEGKGDIAQIDIAMELYQFLAQCYLKMPPDEFQRADWGELKIIIDACQYRTVRTLPKFSRALYEYYHLGKARLNDDEYDCLRTYRLWTGKSKTKPWEINGGIVYEEDLNMVLEMEELEISGRNYREKKHQAISSAGEGGGTTVGEDGVVHKRSIRAKNR